MTHDKLMTTYSVDKTNKLIDLNGDKTNFRCSFKCESENGEDFYVAVADQNTLDNETLNYTTSKGRLAKTFTSNNNIYQNHFLVLKSDSPSNVTVTIDLQELPTKMPSDEEVRKLEMIQQQAEQECVEQNTGSVEPKYNYTRIFLFCLVGIGLISLVYYIYTPKKESSSPAYGLDRDLETKIDDILKSSNEVLLQPVIKPLSPSYTTVPTPENISSPIRSPMYSPEYASPEREASPGNNISNTIHEKLMEKLKKSSIAY